MGVLKFYLRKDVLKTLVDCARGKEVGVFYGNGFRKRPDIIQFEEDVRDFVNNGAVSFHISEENWEDPMELKPGMSKKQYDDLRSSWDLLIDIDGPFECSKIAAYLIVEALKFHDIKNISVKFSGNKGFHIGVPSESFPENVHSRETKLLFPEGMKIIAEYLQDLIRDHLKNMLLEKFGEEGLSKLCGKNINELKTEGEIEPFKAVNIDSILISNRHLFRAPCSMHEKSGLVSLPINYDEILSFEKTMAEPDNIKEIPPFLDRKKSITGEASSLIIQAFDWSSRNKKVEEKVESGKKFEYSGEAMTNEDLFPPCIKLGLQGLEDGKKRFLFALVNFLKHLGWDDEMIKDRIKKWNEKNPDHLKENYYVSQLNWHKRQNEKILPPNCSNASYYKEIGICKPDGICGRIKNPVNYSFIRLRGLKENQKPKKSKSEK